MARGVWPMFVLFWATGGATPREAVLELLERGDAPAVLKTLEAAQARGSLEDGQSPSLYFYAGKAPSSWVTSRRPRRPTPKPFRWLSLTEHFQALPFDYN